MRRPGQRPDWLRLRVRGGGLNGTGPAGTGRATPNALDLLERGLAVFALPTGSKVAAPGWHQQITTDPADIAGWPPGSNIGIGCRASNLVGLDLDRKNDTDGAQVDGVDTLKALSARARRPWPATFTVATAGGGLHLYFRAPAGIVVPSSISRWPGIDIRAPGRRLGGYLAGPGSVIAGRSYTITRDVPIRPLPVWLTAYLTNRPRNLSTVLTSTDSRT